jgi:lipoprotein-anchoring transpeptidase ErfK/SrfK
MLKRIAACCLLATLATPVGAQSWAPWYQESLLALSRPQAERGSAPRQQPASASRAALVPQRAPAVLEGGPQPDIAPVAPATVSISTGHGAGTIVIDTGARRLYLMQSSSTALAYPISVGRIGFTWTGSERISRVASWPDWRPPAEMRARQPGLPEVMTGGIRNPLGAKALYLGSSLYRIHGTNSAHTIGQANSSGCFRMMNGHVVDLAGRVDVGTMVVVKSKL